MRGHAAIWRSRSAAPPLRVPAPAARAAATITPGTARTTSAAARTDAASATTAAAHTASSSATAADVIPGLALAARLALAVVLLAAAIGKARDFRAFAVPLRGLGLPRQLAKAATAGLIAVEAGLGLVVWSGQARELAAVVAALLLAAFVGVAVFALASGREVACNCFGSGSARLGWATVARSGLMGMGLALYALGPAFSWPTTLSGTFNDAALIATSTLGMLLLARWTLTVPTLARLIAARRASKREVGRLIDTLRAAPEPELTLEEAM